jgi:hypothetical protein
MDRRESDEVGRDDATRWSAVHPHPPRQCGSREILGLTTISAGFMSVLPAETRHCREAKSAELRNGGAVVDLSTETPIGKAAQFND